MTNNDRFSIAMAEELFRDTSDDAMDEWYHAYLFLMEKDPASGAEKVLQRLCFNNTNGWVLTPNVRQGFEQSAQNANSGLSLVSVLSGAENEIFAKWNQALRAGQRIKDIEAVFGANFKESPTALNCRTGVKAVVEALDLTFKEDFVKSQAGIQCDKLSTAIVGITPPRILSWEEIREENADLVASLQL